MIFSYIVIIVIVIAMPFLQLHVSTFTKKRSDYNANIHPYQIMLENREVGDIEARANY